MALSFAFDPSKGETLQTIAQRRQMSNLIAARMLGTAPKNVGEGLNAIGQALIARSMMGDADAAQKAGEASLPDWIKGQITGQPATPSVATPPAVAAQPMGSTTIPVSPADTGPVVPNDANAFPGTVGMNMALADRSQDFIQDNPNTYLSSGVRSTADQARLYADRGNNPNPVARPGTSNHERGMAIDIGGMTPSQRAMLPQYGLAQPVANDPPHVELAKATDASSPLDTAQWPAGPVGAPGMQVAQATPQSANDGAELPPNAQPTGGALPTAQAVQAGTQPKSFGPFADISDKDLKAGLMNAFTPDHMRPALLAEYKFRQEAAQKAADPMHALDMQSKTLAIKKAQQDLEKPDETFGVIGQDPNSGKSQYGFINTKTGAVRPYNVPQTGNTPTGSLQEAMKAGVSGADLYQYMPPDRARTVQAMIEGRMPPPSTTAMRSPATMQLIDAANAIDPNFDATTWKSRSTFNQQFGSQTPSSIGGQKVLMGTALGHLGEVAESAAKLSNTDGLGLAKAGHLANYFKNQTTGQAAIANALEDKVAKFSGEVGKLYSGSQGGGVHEREDTRNRLGSNLTSAELASGLEASRDLILSKQKALEDQASTIFGPEGAKKFDFIGPEGRDAIKKIDESIMRLRGQNPSASPTDGQRKTSSGVSWSIQ